MRRAGVVLKEEAFPVNPPSTAVILVHTHTHTASRSVSLLGTVLAASRKQNEIPRATHTRYSVFLWVSPDLFRYPERKAT